MVRPTELSASLMTRLGETLGYLNFSSGAHDPKFLRNLNELYVAADEFPAVTKSAGKSAANAERPAYRALADLLRAGIEKLRLESSPLGDAAQAAAVVDLVFEHVLPGYLEFHRDLLFHQQPGQLFTPLFIGRVAQAVLAAGPPWEDADRITASAIRHLNDYVGYRPVAQHRSGRKGEPYEHERVRPVPILIADVGPDNDRYHEVVAMALQILRQADPAVLRAAWFDLDLLDELAYDPRAYDFDHPVHKRPNHHFGQWDLDLIDQRGFYRRFVAQHVTLDALSSRIADPQLPKGSPKVSREELLFEAAAVLAGTMLMGSGTSGNGPECHDSTVTLANLLPRIARYRDSFYTDLITRVSGAHADRLQAEAARLKQPFGGARQHLNACLARMRAAQMGHVHVAHVYAEMGYPNAARREAAVIPVASARMICEIRCQLTSSERDLEQRSADIDDALESVAAVRTAAERLVEAEDLLHRAIECGAMVDPWNINWFSAHFGLFRSIEDSVYDHRVDQLIEMLERIFLNYGRLVSEAFSAGDEAVGQALLERMDRLAEWWDQFATTTTQSVESFSGRELHDSAAQVGRALAAWHQGGAASGNVAFWRQHVAEFRSPRTFARVVETLLENHDFVAAMALLVQWLAQAAEVPLEEGDDSFHNLVTRWMATLLAGDNADRLVSARKLLDFLEANAEEYWNPPELRDADQAGGEKMLRELFGEQGDADNDADGDDGPGDEEDEEEDGSDDLFGAAYENVVFRDSAADGTEGELADSGIPGGTDYEFEEELKRISDRLAFLSTVAGLWKQVAVEVARDAAKAEQVGDALVRWQNRAGENQQRLRGLIAAVQRYRIAAPTGAFESYVEYDRRRSMKESLLERIIAAAADAADALELLAAVSGKPLEEQADTFSGLAAAVDRALITGMADDLAKLWPDTLAAVRKKTSLYMPLARGGDPLKIADARALHQRLRQWLAWLPRLGMLTETAHLIDGIRAMEVEHPVGPGAVTEFDRLFETGYKAIVDAIVVSSNDWNAAALGESADRLLNEAVQTVTEPLLSRWLAHSQTLRLSALERVDNDKDWKELRAFVENYGNDLFHQQFMNLGNLRAILHQGVDDWIRHLEEREDQDEEAPRFVEELDAGLVRGQVVRQLTMILESIIDNYVEYRDYNSTTTQSDRGEMLYTFLDFLRLKAAYERAHWNLRPVIMAHEMLVRRGRSEAAELWRRALVERTSEIADRLMRRLERLQKQYGMRLPTVADRIAERFVRPLDADRVLALVRPAMEEARANDDEANRPAFSQLAQEIDELTAEPTGAGLDVPDWLAALEDEVDMVQNLRRRSAADPDAAPVPRMKLSYEAVMEQARRMAT